MNFYSPLLGAAGQPRGCKHFAVDSPTRRLEAISSTGDRRAGSSPSSAPVAATSRPAALLIGLDHASYDLVAGSTASTRPKIMASAANAASFREHQPLADV